ncbi:hypothetical protein BH09ACT1_BH09ACT1_17840 [soil metagenome]
MNDNSFRSRLSNFDVSRRGVLAGAVGIAAAAALAACSPLDTSTPAAPASTAKTGKGGGITKNPLAITMFCFLGGDLAVMGKEFGANYMERHPNISITYYEDSNLVGYGKMLAQRQSDPSKPLVNFGFFNTSTTAQGVGDKMWNKLDYADMSNSKDIAESFTRADHHGIGIGSDQLGLVYNTDTYSKAPTQWSDLWAKKNVGKLSFFGMPWYAIYQAALANGGSLKNMDPGFKFWADNADLIRLIVTSNPQYLNVLSDGTSPLTTYFAGTTQQWVTGGAPLKYAVPKDGAIPVPVLLQSVAGQGEDEQVVVQDMINEMISPKWSQRWAETAVQVPANTLTKTPAQFDGLAAFKASTIKNFQKIDYDIVGKNTAAWTERWNSEVVSKI